MNLSTQLAQLILNGAKIYFYKGETSPANLGDAEWIEGRGLLYAELWAENQSHVHLIPAASLADDAGAIDVIAADGSFVASIYGLPPGEALDAQMPAWQSQRAAESWSRFWASQIVQARA